jgi:hypothetical protein
MPTIATRLASIPLLFLCLAACPPDDTGGSGTGGTATSDRDAAGDDQGPWFDTMFDTTPSDPPDRPGPCTDDYDGNQDPASAHPLAIDTTHTVQTILGDHLVSRDGTERGQDRLVACPEHPDFFSIEPACAGYLGVDLRRLDGGPLDLRLYADGQLLEHALGTWHGFFLKPLHRRIQARPHTIEVRHAGGAPSPYSLEVYFLPAPSCP